MHLTLFSSFYMQPAEVKAGVVAALTKKGHFPGHNTIKKITRDIIVPIEDEDRVIFYSGRVRSVLHFFAL